MNYLLLICSDGVPTADKGAHDATAGAGRHAVQDTSRAGRTGLRPEQLAGPAMSLKTVRVRDGETHGQSYGPFLDDQGVLSAGFDHRSDCADSGRGDRRRRQAPGARWFHMIEARAAVRDRPGQTLAAAARSWPTNRGDADELAAKLASPGRGSARRRYLLTVSRGQHPRNRRGRGTRSPATPRRGSPRWEPGGSECMGTNPGSRLTPRRRCANA